MKNMKKVLGLAAFALVLDIIALISLIVMMLSSTNIWAIAFLALILLIIGWDAFNATSFIIMHYKDR